MTIEEAIETASDCIRAGVAERVLFLTLMDEGFSQEKSKLIIQWAKRHQAKKE